ncbi:hypothetical protein VMCG_06938 [Cytospora schulzeri]|uniref:Uncharacterized protein n=1 Tax=Cytospora schulzeri TaxID=448051 RepID=A0A423W272_9PEZI|nr:hypothetical protein VMCG_06938 [Valsa malicola]
MKQESKTPEEITDELLFKTSLDEFITRREKRDPTDLVWESDGCTHAPDNPMGFNFLPACQRHDFGYRNYRAQNRLTKATKKEINKQFKNDLHGICHRYLLRRPACKITATLFYEAVKHNHIDDDALARLD